MKLSIKRSGFLIYIKLLCDFFLRHHKLVGKARILIYDPGTTSYFLKISFTIYQNKNADNFTDLSIIPLITNKKDYKEILENAFLNSGWGRTF